MTEEKTKPKPGKKEMTEKQKKARLNNLLVGRQKRMENLKRKKEEKNNKQDEYDLTSEEPTDSSSDEGDFIISKKKPAKKKDAPKPKPRSRDESPPQKNEIEELKNMVMDLALMQKKHNKAIRKHTTKPVNKLVLLPQTSAPAHESNHMRDSMMDMLRKSLM